MEPNLPMTATDGQHLGFSVRCPTCRQVKKLLYQGTTIKDGRNVHVYACEGSTCKGTIEVAQRGGVRR